PNKSQKFSDPVFFEKIAASHPGVKIILAHAGGRGDYFYKVIDLIEGNKNLYVDFAGDIFEPFLIKSYVDRVGSDKLLFGTDLPWVDLRYYLSNIINSQIADTDRQNILGLNALKLFGPKISLS
ncbi:MAG TPA: amidohydrolase family protein, partial [Candidatus Humimicrobiaceae bacterium]